MSSSPPSTAPPDRPQDLSYRYIEPVRGRTLYISLPSRTFTAFPALVLNWDGTSIRSGEWGLTQASYLYNYQDAPKLPAAALTLLHLGQYDLLYEQLTALLATPE